MALKRNPLDKLVGKSIQCRRPPIGIQALSGEVLDVRGTLITVNLEYPDGSEHKQVFDLNSDQICDLYVREKEGKESQFDELYDLVGVEVNILIRMPSVTEGPVEEVLAIDDNVLITRRAHKGNVYTSFFTLINGRTTGEFTETDSEEEKPKKGKAKPKKKAVSKKVEEEEVEEEVEEDEEVYEDDVDDDDDDDNDASIFDDDDVDFDDDDDDWDDD